MHKFFRCNQKGQWSKTSKTGKTGKISILALFGLLTGCATQAPLKAPTPSNEPLYALDTVAIQTASNIKELSAIEAANLQKTSTQSQWREFMFNLQAVPVELSKKETFNFVGIAQDAVKGIADLAGFNFHVVGSAPAQPLMVFIKSDNQMLIDSLRDINAQINHKASLMISPQAKLITLTFRQVGEA
ncbi:DotD/TraH family lipoprotein [Cysteiniphilum marinum]|uniref:DotD/TraH family lipoprotein n=1 Tax=Cysteiniphilum marinum TaxID=2774191 RepID=UPI00193A489A|nr:DotD/TraH family lipoprotein [Cysteiniphilum marinum]